MRLTGPEARARFASARVARLATADAAARPHLVPIVFALDGDVLYTAVDDKPKSTRNLRRLANVAANPQVAVLVDDYAEDWNRLWWARADGTARVVEGQAARVAVELLTARYVQYAHRPPPGPVIAVDVRAWTGWQAAAAR